MVCTFVCVLHRRKKTHCVGFVSFSSWLPSLHFSFLLPSLSRQTTACRTCHSVQAMPHQEQLKVHCTIVLSQIMFVFVFESVYCGAFGGQEAKDCSFRCGSFWHYKGVCLFCSDVDAGIQLMPSGHPHSQQPFPLSVSLLGNVGRAWLKSGHSARGCRILRSQAKALPWTTSAGS